MNVMVAELGSVGPQNRPPANIDAFDDEKLAPLSHFKIPKIYKKQSDDNIHSNNEATTNSVFKIKLPIANKTDLAVIVQNKIESRPLESEIFVAGRSNQNYKNKIRNHLNRNPFRRDSFKHQNRTFHSNANRSHQLSQVSPVRQHHYTNEKYTGSIAAPVNQCTHTCTSAQASASLHDNTKLTLEIADPQKILSANEPIVHPLAQKRKRLSSGQHKRFKRAADNKLKRDLGFDKWWELQRANVLKELETKKKN